MKYFLDTEFIESFRKRRIGLFKTKFDHFVDLISIGIVCEDGREYYAISTEFNPKEANQWVKENVLSKLPERHVPFSDPGTSPRSRYEAMLWKDHRTINKDLLHFFGYTIQERHPETGQVVDMSTDTDIQVYGYFADYDWVVFCSLFGRMMDLPYEFPMYCRDLKQMMVERELTSKWKKAVCPDPENEHNALEDARWNFKLYKEIMTQDFIIKGDPQKML